MADSDDEIGRGRQHLRDSLSSRESSPQPGKDRQKRSFSPTSDDGDLVVPPVITEDNDDTPPPEPAPIIRQAVAFSSVFSPAAAVPTYQATQPPSSSASRFLPGQEVYVPPSPPKPKKRPPARRTKRYNDQFAQHTGTFRIQNYDVVAEASPAVPPVFQGDGPYSSMYRAYPTPASSAATPPGPSSGGSPAPGPLPARDPRSLDGPGRPSITPTLDTYQTAFLEEHHSKRKHSNSNSAEKDRNAISKKNPSKRPVDYLAAATNSHTISNDNSYHRRDYDNNKTYNISSGSVAAASTSRYANGGLTGQDFSTSSSISRSGSTDAARSPQSSNGVYETSLVPRKPPRPVRMVTLLIDDIRSGTSDNQLVEIRVPLRPADSAEDGYWADAKDVVEALQNTPSRIDGPARLFTMRGKYRQIFLRISAEGVEESTTANLSVSTERTLDIVIESAPIPGTLPRPPQIPQDLMPFAEHDPYYTGNYSGVTSSPQPEISMGSTPGASPRDRRKRRRSERSSPSPSSGYAHGHKRSTYPQSPSSRLSALPALRSRRPTSVSTGSYNGTPRPHPSSTPERHPRTKDRPQSSTGPLPRSESPPSEPGELAETQEEIDEAIAEWIKPIIEEDPGWMKFMESRAKPQRVCEVLKQYDFVQEKMDMVKGKRTPNSLDGAPNQPVRDEHVLQVLSLPVKWGLECTEMLTLLKYYGEKGERSEDSRIVDMVNDMSLPQGRPAKRCLHLLRDIHKEWLEKHSDAVNGVSENASATNGQ